jgi:hypothetical protein
LVARFAAGKAGRFKVAATEAVASALRGSCDAGDPKFGSGSHF